ncbi:cupin domain-containing protein [Paenibacillus sp. GCM10012307]|uniref:Cupin domain-containing protein n=1 Tax=Paenibacillus roseus TaxID=2798579 RepID=A0A934IWK7_9BACL|nr:cupin domain-containing protein [Paenibacillus roseus]MBJ6360632.1 cupin domain-containing protein [Paenibacillus roseus]
MYPSCNHYYWQNSMQSHWNNKWSYNWNPHDYNWNNRNNNPYGNIALQDYGARPFVVNIDQAAKQNHNYRTALWTGTHLQVTLMSINVGEDIGLEVHPTTDQFIRIEEGQGLIQMGNSRDNLDFQAMAYNDYAIMIPAGTWHNVINTGNRPLKVYSIYAPPKHPFGTVEETKAIAQGTK